ncbi:MAG: TolC family protein [Planctomycetaceae bacterium]
MAPTVSKLDQIAKGRLLVATSVISGLLLSSGCGIPERRCAQQGPILPSGFYHPFRPLMDPPDSPDSPKPAPAEEEADPSTPGVAAKAARSVAQRIRFVNFESSDEAAADETTTSAAASDDVATPVFPVLAKQESYAPGLDAPAAPDANPALVPESAVLGSDEDETGHAVVNGDNAMLLTWSQFFSDPHLASLIGQALAGNQELKILSEEIWIANNEVTARSGEYLPFVNIGAGAGVDKSSRYTRNGAVEEALEVAPGKSFPDPLPDFLVAANVSWEIDIWRKLRNARDAAAFRYLGTQDGQNYVVTRLIAEIAEKYYDLLALDNRLMILDKTIQIQKDSLRMAEDKQQFARGTALAVQRFQAEVRKNESEKYLVEQEIIEVENRINFLLGRYPQPVERMSLDYIDLELHSLSTGVPAQLLQNRSDIRQAERAVAAAGLDLEVARARFYPSLNLRAGIGYQAFNPKYLFVTPEALIFNAVGELAAPLINKRAIQAAYRSANAKQIQCIYEYQRTVLNAYTEVVNYMTKSENYRQSIDIKKQQLAALEASVESATLLFANARAEYVEVLLAQREMMEARMILIDTKRDQLAAVVNLYQALGGGGGAFMNCR